MSATDPSSGYLRPPRLAFSSMLTQMYPPRPTFAEKDVPDLSDKVYVVTGSNTGVGKEVARILYSKNAKVYITARSEDKARQAIQDIEQTSPQSQGQLVYLHVDLADLASVKSSALHLLAKEQKLHVLFNNAAVQALKDTDGAAKTAQGKEIHLGVNVLGPFLFTKLLTPLLVKTARREPPGTVRVVWVSSMGTEVVGEHSHGMTANYLHYWPKLSPLERYGVSKAGNWLHAVEFAARYGNYGVLSVPCNPGHLKSDLYREGGRWLKTLLNTVVLQPPVYGAYTELFSAFSPVITAENNGSWVVPWGRLYPIRPDLLDATRSKDEGGNGHAQEFWDWSEKQVAEFLPDS